MTQRKLTDEELQDVMHARHYLRKCNYLQCHAVYASIVLDGLDNIAKECTTDGRPYVKPQPEIGDGYRRGTEADAWRSDVEFLTKDGEHWEKRCHSIDRLSPGYTYRVPVDSIPTDEDARQRPIVMVRDDPTQPWQKTVLVAVANGAEGSFWEKSFNTVSCWRTCRFPYPGELD